MQIILLLVAMLFFHIVDDYYLQGVLASMKQKSWWEKNAPDPLYKNDYVMALAEHAFSWTVMIHIPIIVYVVLNHAPYHTIAAVGLFIFSWLLHALMDHIKANLKMVGLIEDQLFHVFQIFMIWSIYVLEFA